MKKLLIVIALLFLPFPASADVKEYSLSNGIKVLVTEDHKAPLAVFQIWYRVGSRNEPAGKTGMSHLLEHMMFKGTAKYGSKVLSHTVQRLGGTNNAFTTKDYTVYYQRLPSDKIGISIELEADRMQGLVLDEKETLAERSVVMEERRLRYEDDPAASLFEEVMSLAFKSHPYQWPVIGWMSDLESIQREDLHNYYRNYYSPDNAVIVISGDISPDEIIKKVEANFSKMEPGHIKRQSVSKEPTQKGERRVYLKKQAELPSVLIAYHVPSFPHEDSASLDVLATVLSGGRSSRIYKSLIYESRLALDASAGYGGLNKDPYLFFLEGTPLPGKDVSEVENALYKEIEKIKEEPPSEIEVQKAKNQIEAGFIMGQDSIYFQAELLGMFEMLGGWRLKDKYLDGIRKVTPKDLQEAAKKYLHEDNRTVGVLVPLKEKK